MGSWKGALMHSGRSIFAVLMIFSIVNVVAYQVLLMSNQLTKLGLKRVERTQHTLRKSETIWVNVGWSIKLLQAPAESSRFVMDSEKVSLNMTSQPTRLAESNQFMRNSEKVSLNMTNQPPRVAESSQFMRESETIWVNVGPEMFVFSAYLDTRDISYSSKPRRVVALAMQNDKMKHALLYCHLTDSNGHAWCLKHHISKIAVKKTPKI